VDHAVVVGVGDLHTSGFELVGVGRALIAEWIEFGGDDHGGGEALV